MTQLLPCQEPHCNCRQQRIVRVLSVCVVVLVSFTVVGCGSSSEGEKADQAWEARVAAIKAANQKESERVRKALAPILRDLWVPNQTVAINPDLVGAKEFKRIYNRLLDWELANEGVDRNADDLAEPASLLALSMQE